MNNRKNMITEKNLIIFVDIFLVFAAFYIAVLVKIGMTEPVNFKLIISSIDSYIFVWIIFCPVIFYSFELYEKNNWRHNVKLLKAISFSVVLTSLIIGLFSLLEFSKNNIDRFVIMLYVACAIPLLFFWRKMYLVTSLNNLGPNQTITIIGEDKIIDDIKLFFSKEGIKSVTHVRNFLENNEQFAIGMNKLVNIMEENQSKVLVIGMRLDSLPFLRKQLIDLRFAGVAIYDACFYYETLTGMIPVSRVSDSWFLFHNQGEFFNNWAYRLSKAFFDKILSLIFLIISFPLMIVTAITIKLTSKGPIIFSQERMGQNEQPYTLIKFRTMRNNAEELTGPRWATENDRRVTSVGKFLRKTRLDELPQLFNIVKGDMSFVGPRPIRKVMADMLAEDFPYYRLRFSVKPGLTGWAQVKGGYAGTKEGQYKKLKYDLYYIQNQSILFDLLILLKTVQTVIFSRGT